MPATFHEIATKITRPAAALNVAARVLWYLPGSFGMARILGPGYSLRCILFHNIADSDSVFTRGLGGTISCKEFEAALSFITRFYTPVSLEEVLASLDGGSLPSRPMLVTFDDAYGSICRFAVPLCSKFRVPAVFFINAACLDNRHLALDNLVCYVANVIGVDALNSAIHAVKGCEDIEVQSLQDIFTCFLPKISLAARRTFRKALVKVTEATEQELLAEAALYLSSEELRSLASFNVEIGNHTYTHVNCRSLLEDDFPEEIDHNKTLLERISGRKVRSFSVPYGSSADLTATLQRHLQRSGHHAVFLAEARTNSRRTGRYSLNRVSTTTGVQTALFSGIEILPRLRTLRNELLERSH